MKRQLPDHRLYALFSVGVDAHIDPPNIPYTVYPLLSTVGAGLAPPALSSEYTVHGLQQTR